MVVMAAVILEMMLVLLIMPWPVLNATFLLLCRYLPVYRRSVLRFCAIATYTFLSDIFLRMLSGYWFSLRSKRIIDFCHCRRRRRLPLINISCPDRLVVGGAWFRTLLAVSACC